MGVVDLDARRLRADFRAEVRQATRTTALAGGVIAIIAFPSWAIFDHLVDPSHGVQFATLRFALEVPLILLWLTLFTRVGRRYPEAVMLLMLALVQGVIAYMTTHVVDAYAPYALGMSLGIYASSFLLIWPWQYTAALIGLSWAALLASIATAPPTLDAAAIATIGFYLGTASEVAFVGQLHRRPARAPHSGRPLPPRPRRGCARARGPPPAEPRRGGSPAPVRARRPRGGATVPRGPGPPGPRARQPAPPAGTAAPGTRRSA